MKPPGIRMEAEAQPQNAVINPSLQQNPQTQINWQLNQQNGDREFQLNPPNQEAKPALMATSCM